MALRRNLQSDPNQFPRDVMELQAYFAGNPELGITAVPGAGADVDLWILGSSLFGAHMAALMGLPYAFASHFDRKSVVSGKSVSVRVDLGGRRIIKKKNITRITERVRCKASKIFTR